MKYLTILENGEVWPGIETNDSIVSVNGGTIRVGRYNKKNYLGNIFYLDTPHNEMELINELKDHIKAQNENLLKIDDANLHFVCPKEISSRFVWHK